MKKKILLSLPIILLIGLILVQTVTAATSSIPGSVGGVNAISSKGLYLGGGWTSDLRSSAESPISIIGYTYWTLEEYCPGDQLYAYWTQFPGDYSTNDDVYYTNVFVGYRGCNDGISIFRGKGNHDYGGFYQPYVSVEELR